MENYPAMILTGNVFEIIANTLKSFSSYRRRVSQIIVDDNIKIHILFLQKDDTSDDDDDDEIYSTYIEAIYTIKITTSNDLITISAFATDDTEPCYMQTANIHTAITRQWFFTWCVNAFSLDLVSETKFAKVKISEDEFDKYKNVMNIICKEVSEKISLIKNEWCKVKVQSAIFAALVEKAPTGARCLCINYSPKSSFTHLFEIMIDSNKLPLSISCPKINLEISRSFEGPMEAFIKIYKNKMDYYGTVYLINNLPVDFSLEKLPFDNKILDIIADKIWSSLQIPLKEVFSPYSKSLFHPAIKIHRKIS